MKKILLFMFCLAMLGVAMYFSYDYSFAALEENGVRYPDSLSLAIVLFEAFLSTLFLSMTALMSMIIKKSRRR